MTTEVTCGRFRRDGERCSNLTDNADRWCRQPGCDGYLRSSTDISPASLGAPRGTRSHIARAGSPRPNGIDFDSVDEVRVTQRAVDCFIFHHGGDRATAETEILTMLEDFAQRGSERERKGFLAIARDGYEIVLSPDRDAVTFYSTVHRERTWSQFKAGVSSRFRKARERPVRPAPDQGPAVVVEPPHAVLAMITVDTIHLTASSYARGIKMMASAGGTDSVDDYLRRVLARDLDTAPTVERSDTGAHLITSDSRTWIVRSDLLAVLGVRPC